MFMHTGCPAVAISLEDGTFDPDVRVSAKLSTDRKTLTISIPPASPKLKTATWTVPIVGKTSVVPIKFETAPAPPVESALSLNLAFGRAAAPTVQRTMRAQKVTTKKAPAKKAASKVAPKKRR